MASNFNCNRILVVAPSWLGDFIMSQALLKLIKQKHPNAEIDVLAAPYLHPILNYIPEVTNALTSPFKHGEFNFSGRRILGHKLRKNNYSHAYVLPNSFKSALVPFFAKIPHRIGWRGEMRYVILNDLRKLDTQKYPLMVEQYLALGLDNQNDPLPDVKNYYPSFVPTKEHLENSLQKFQPHTKTKNKVIAFCYGGDYGPSKRWPTIYFAETAQKLKQQGWDVWLFGGKKDLPLANEIQHHSNNTCIDFTGKTDLSEAIDLLSQSDAVISNDTGLMHIAAALAKPLVAIYGSTSPGFTPPLSKNVQIVKLNLSCSPCFKRTCPLGHFKCMLNLKPDMVIKALGKLDSH